MPQTVLRLDPEERIEYSRRETQRLHQRMFFRDQDSDEDGQDGDPLNPDYEDLGKASG